MGCDRINQQTLSYEVDRAQRSEEPAQRHKGDRSGFKLDLMQISVSNYSGNSSPLQALAQRDGSSQCSREEEKKAENETGLPDSLKEGIESLSGYDLSGVRVNYNSPKPAQLNAHAYTQGQAIEVAPGQERHLPHESWHVVQQMQGRVRPTMEVNGYGVNDERRLEREADAMGQKAVQMKKTEEIEPPEKLEESAHPLANGVRQRKAEVSSPQGDGGIRDEKQPGCSKLTWPRKEGQGPQVIQLLRLRTAKGKDLDFSEDKKIESREASHGVYIKGGRVYKVFGNKAAAEKEYKETTKASVDYGVPIAEPVDCYAATIEGGSKEAGVFESAEIRGKFFQLSKGPALEKRVREIEDATQLNWLLRRLKAARDAKLSDPQGFIVDDTIVPIIFIDIHMGTSAHVAIIDLVDEAEAKLALGTSKK